MELGLHDIASLWVRMAEFDRPNCFLACRVQNFIPQTGLPVSGFDSFESCSFERGASLGRRILHLSPGLVFLMKYALDALLACLPHFTFVSHLSPLISHLSPTRLWILCPHDFFNRFFSTCLRLSPITRLWMLCSHDFAFISQLCLLVPYLSPTGLWMLCPPDFTFASHLSPLVSHLAPPKLESG